MIVLTTFNHIPLFVLKQEIKEFERHVPILSINNNSSIANKIMHVTNSQFLFYII